MKKLPKISEAEWQVMQVLWARSPLTANEVIERLEPVASWKPKTIRTLITRLVQKKALGVNKEGREHKYSSLVEEAECVRAESRSFLKRVYGGALTPMLVHLLEEQALSSEEIAELKRVLDEREG